MMDKARKALLLVMAAVGLGSVGLQAFLNLTRHNLDHSVAWRLVDFLSYFTNLSAILATIVAILVLTRPSSRLAGPDSITAAAVYLVVVAVTYEWLLRGEAHGLAFVADTGLHQVLPALGVLLWLVTPKAQIGWREPFAWLAYPAVYMAWTLLRGAVLHRYPYFFVDVDKLGYPQVLLTGAAFLATFYLLGLAAVATGRVRLTRKAPAAA